MLLKLKAKIYQLTGIYLAHKEESDYLQSKEFWKSFEKLVKGKDKDMKNPRNAQGLLIGLWQAKHGFARMPYSWRIRRWLKKRKTSN